MTDAAKLLTELVDSAGLEPRGRDAGFMEDVASMLSPGSPEAFQKKLEAGDISSAQLIAAIFEAIAPYTEMMRDLLKLFVRAGAREGAHNLEIELNFAQLPEALRFDLQQFRTWERRWSRHVETATVRSWNHDYLREIRKAFGGPPASMPLTNAAALAWLQEYETARRWPSTDLAPPDIDGPVWAEVLPVLWAVWEEVVQGSRRRGASRDVLRQEPWTPNLDPLTGPPTGQRPLRDDAWLLRQLDHASWAGSMVSALFRLEGKGARMAYLADDLRGMLAEIPERELTIEERREILQDIFRMPVWQRRHELYAAWIACPLVNALGPEAVVHAVDGRLTFSFSGTHVASVRTSAGEDLYLWAELRTPLANPKGEGRVGAIQPDYSVCRAPVTAPESTVLVVECKQYEKQSTRGFAAALEDYAKGRPNATALLVNYGSIVSSSVQALVDEGVRSRTGAFGKMRPGLDSTRVSFEGRIASILSPRWVPRAREPLPDPAEEARERPSGAPPAVTARRGVGAVTLRWPAAPADLDLHVWLEDGASPVEVSFRARGRLDTPPFVELSADCRSAPGEEVITFGRSPPSFRCAIHRYSNDGELRACNATLAVDLEGSNLMLTCPAVGEGAWWHAFEYDAASRRFWIINVLAPTDERIARA